jgi:hypothetical protein
MNQETLLIAFGVAYILEFGAFGMQRATLLMSREVGVTPQIGALLLPSWFPIVWLVRLVKWALFRLYRIRLELGCSWWVICC